MSVIVVDGKVAMRTWAERQKRIATEAELDLWFRDTEYGVGIVCGNVSGRGHCLAVRDFDDPTAYERWAKRNPGLAKRLPTVSTGRDGGRHVYFRGPAGIRTASQLGDGELRAEGAYVVAPPSLHPDGLQYRWIIPPDEEIPLLAASEVVLLGKQPTEPAPEHPGTHRDTDKHPPYLCLSVGVSEGAARAIERTQPTGPGQRGYQLFQLCRHLKTLPEFRDADADILKPIVRDWHSRALPVIRTKGFDASWLDFRSGWTKVRTLVGEDLVADCFGRALTNAPPEFISEYDTAKIRLLILLCRELQKATGDEPFFLSCRKAAETLQADHSDVAAWLRGLVADGVLRIADAPPRGSMKAIRYRYLKD